jgi:hypothetical protein
MVKIGVDDVDAWHQKARDIADSGQFANIEVKPIEDVDGFRVLHVVDPSGVLLVFVQ